MSRVQQEPRICHLFTSHGRARKAAMEALHKLLTFPDWSLALQKEQQAPTQRRVSLQIVTGNNLAAGHQSSVKVFCPDTLLVEKVITRDKEGSS